MSRLGDLYKAMETLRKEGLPVDENLEKKANELEEEIIKKEINLEQNGCLAKKFYSFNLPRNFPLGRKLTICRLVIVIDWPVFGLRPRRGDLSRTFKLPNWTNLIDSPLTKVSFKVAKTVSTISAAFRWEIPSFSVTEMANSFRVTFFLFIQTLAILVQP